MITTKSFGTTEDGREVLAFTLQDGDSYAVILNYGGTLQSLVVPDRNGRPTDVVLGYPTMTGYERNGGYLGALIGRFGNRIKEGQFTLDGKTYLLACNDRGNHLHGGKVGFNKKIWEHRIEGDSLILTLFSPDGEEGYPGNLTVTVIYTFIGGELKIQYHAVTDKKTIVNLTNHAYFNLSGEASGSILSNRLWLASNYFVPTSDSMIPAGGYRSALHSPFDFTSPKEIGRDIQTFDPDLKRGNGYDHCYMISKERGAYEKFAEASSLRTGIVMECFTDLPAVQFYSGNGLHQHGKGCYYGSRAGFCLETQMVPDCVNQPEYAARGSAVLYVGETYEHVTAYKFTAK